MSRSRTPCSRNGSSPINLLTSTCSGFGGGSVAGVASSGASVSTCRSRRSHRSRPRGELRDFALDKLDKFEPAHAHLYTLLRLPVPDLGSTELLACPRASLSSLGVRASTPRAWGLRPVFPPGCFLPSIASLLW